MQGLKCLVIFPKDSQHVTKLHIWANVVLSLSLNLFGVGVDPLTCLVRRLDLRIMRLALCKDFTTCTSKSYCAQPLILSNFIFVKKTFKILHVYFTLNHIQMCLLIFTGISYFYFFVCKFHVHVILLLFLHIYLFSSNKLICIP